MPPIRGYENSIVHNRPRPKRLPACVYVAMPLGSSSDAPVIRPGPSRSRRPLRVFERAVRLDAVVVELIGLAFGVHSVRGEVVADGGSVASRRLVMGRLFPLCHSTPHS